MVRASTPGGPRTEHQGEFHSSEDYLPIEDYGVIGDLQTVALVGRNGSIDWCAIPDFDSPSVFGALLDVKKGGFFRIAPPDTPSMKRWRDHAGLGRFGRTGRSLVAIRRSAWRLEVCQHQRRCIRRVFPCQ